METAPGQVRVSGLGVITAIGASISEFRDSLERTEIGIRRTTLPCTPGKSVAAAPVSRFDLAALIDALSLLRSKSRTRTQIQRLLTQTTRSTQLSIESVTQAWSDARLEEVSGDSIGLIVGGNNLSQDLTAQAWTRQAQSGQVSPRHAISVQDSYQVGCISELFGLRGPGWTVGAASASGNAALYQGWNLVRAGIVPVCIVVGAATELSLLEWEAFHWLGAMATLDDAEDPTTIHRPFDQSHRGFVWGEGSGCLVLEDAAHARAREVAPLGSLAGASFLLDANSGPDPTLSGEIRAMQSALSAASLSPSDIGYLNAHGTGSPLGDTTEAEAIRTVFAGASPAINSTKPLTGHCLTSAGVVEAIACLIQLNSGFIHGNPNLECSLEPSLNLAGKTRQPLNARFALSNGFGFGGLNGSVVIGSRHA